MLLPHIVLYQYLTCTNNLKVHDDDADGIYFDLHSNTRIRYDPDAYFASIGSLTRVMKPRRRATNLLDSVTGAEVRA